MKCYVHDALDAVGQCNDCQAGLCRDCFQKYDPSVCDTCFTRGVAYLKSQATKHLAVTAGLFVIGMYLFIAVFSASTASMWFKFWNGLMGGTVLAGVPSGWRVLSRMTPNVFLILPLVGWVIYFYLKFAIAMMIGVFVMPVAVWKSIHQLQRA